MNYHARPLLIALVLAGCSQHRPGPAIDAARPLAGVIDLHAHSGPDARRRSVTDPELARLARDAGMRAIVLKNHFTMTADRAALAMAAVPGIEVFGGIVLNRAVGGLNVEAVRQMTRFEGRRGKVVWLPTIDAEAEVRAGFSDGPAVPVLIDGRPAPGLEEILRIIAEHDLVLATGHTSPAEVLELIPHARRQGVQHILVTHALNEKPTLEQARQMAGAGAYLELIASGERPHLSLEDHAQFIQQIGAEHCVLSSDLGQHRAPLHTSGLLAFFAALRSFGIDDAAIDTMARRNPARLLGLDAAAPGAAGSAR